MAGLRGKELMRAVVNQILEHRETWDQCVWHSACGTSHCVAGWCQILGGREAKDESAQNDAMECLGISSLDAAWLFGSCRTLPEIYDFAKWFLSGEAGYDRYGYDRYGYDRYGYNRAGYDRYGYDRYGYDRYGYNRAGYNRAGESLPKL